MIEGRILSQNLANQTQETVKRPPGFYKGIIFDAVSMLAAWSAGYVYLPALLAVVCASTLTARLGANAAHRLPVRVLKQLFSGLLLLIAARMIYRLL